jgi:hypothetical protein
MHFTFKNISRSLAIELSITLYMNVPASKRPSEEGKKKGAVPLFHFYAIALLLVSAVLVSPSVFRES